MFASTAVDAQILKDLPTIRSSLKTSEVNIKDGEHLWLFSYVI